MATWRIPGNEVTQTDFSVYRHVFWKNKPNQDIIIITWLSANMANKTPSSTPLKMEELEKLVWSNLLHHLHHHHYHTTDTTTATTTTTTPPTQPPHYTTVTTTTDTTNTTTPTTPPSPLPPTPQTQPPHYHEHNHHHHTTITTTTDTKNTTTNTTTHTTTITTITTPPTHPSQQIQNICITFIRCRINVEDVGPTLYKCYTNVLCLLGCTTPPTQLPPPHHHYHHCIIITIIYTTKTTLTLCYLGTGWFFLSFQLLQEVATFHRPCPWKELVPEWRWGMRCCSWWVKREATSLERHWWQTAATGWQVQMTKGE